MHPRDDIDRLYEPRRKRGREVTNIEDSIDASIRRLGVDIKKGNERLITAASNKENNNN